MTFDMTFEKLSQNKKTLQDRSLLERYLREWFTKKQFLEITTPILNHHSSLEKNIYPLTTLISNQQGITQNAFLRVSPELSLKKILAAGYEKIFELGKCFRNCESSSSSQHLFEFTLLEWYSQQSLDEMINDFIELVNYLAFSFLGTYIVDYQNFNYNLSSWKKITVQEAFKKYAQIDFDDFETWEDFIPLANSMGFKTNSLDDAFFWIFLNHVEPHIRKAPCILYYYPSFQASFSKITTPVRKTSKTSKVINNLDYGLRFEAYLGGMEIANAFEELTNKEEQKQRWQAYIDNSSQKNLKMDTLFLDALPLINPPISGIALGWERLLMFFLNKKNIRDVDAINIL